LEDDEDAWRAVWWSSGNCSPREMDGGVGRGVASREEGEEALEMWPLGEDDDEEPEVLLVLLLLFALNRSE
jgi:hypothetical protein